MGYIKTVIHAVEYGIIDLMIGVAGVRKQDPFECAITISDLRYFL